MTRQVKFLRDFSATSCFLYSFLALATSHVLLVGDSHSTDQGVGLARVIYESPKYRLPENTQLKVIALCGASFFWFIKGGISARCGAFTRDENGSSLGNVSRPIAEHMMFRDGIPADIVVVALGGNSWGSVIGRSVEAGRKARNRWKPWVKKNFKNFVSENFDGRRPRAQLCLKFG